MVKTYPNSDQFPVVEKPYTKEFDSANMNDKSNANGCFPNIHPYQLIPFGNF